MNNGDKALKGLTATSMYGATVRANRKENQQRIYELQHSLELLPNPDSWYGRQHQALIERYQAVALIWADVPNEFEREQ